MTSQNDIIFQFDRLSKLFDKRLNMTAHFCKIKFSMRDNRRTSARDFGLLFLLFLKNFVCLCAVIFLFSNFSFAQNSEEVVKVETELVPFEVAVTDKKGKPVRGLSADDFIVYEDGVRRKFDFFKPIVKSDESRPLSIVFALDVSGSVTPEELLNLRDAMRTFVRRLADYESNFAVMTFGMRVKVVQSFTNKPEKLEKTFEKILRDQDGLSTHAYDAVDYSVRFLNKKSPPTVRGKLPKRAVILITDGFPVGDTVKPQTVIERANDAETTVYSVILPSFSRLQKNQKPLLTPLEASGLIEKTGGRTFYAREKNFEPLFKLLEEEITSSYVLAFYPTEREAQDGQFHNVRIETSEKYTIKQNRLGYKIKSGEEN